MRFLKTIAIMLAVVFGLGVIVAFFLPDSAHVERSIEIAAPPERIFPYVNDLGRFNEWSPWARLDGGTEYRFEGPSAGVGAIMRWESENPGVGTGGLQIVESEYPYRVRTALDFGSQGVATAFFRLEPLGGRTQVTWGFDVEFGYDLMGRYFGLFMDAWIGPVYEQGLMNLRAAVEAGASG
jgi:hypothetical protein